MARFLENHDEPRTAATFEPGVHEAAAVITFLSPGLRFLHQGQFEGRKKRISPHLGRAPDEPIDAAVAGFYEKLLTCLRSPVLREGDWRLLECRRAWADNPTAEQFLAFSWESPGPERMLVTINYGPTQGQCRVPLPMADLRGRSYSAIA
jgi:hypothetical protein